MAEVTIYINGRSYDIACDNGQEGRIVDLAAYIDAWALFGGEIRSPPRCFREAGLSTVNDGTKPTAASVNYSAELLPPCTQTETACQVE